MFIRHYAPVIKDSSDGYISFSICGNFVATCAPHDSSARCSLFSDLVLVLFQVTFNGSFDHMSIDGTRYGFNPVVKVVLDSAW